MRPAGTFGGRLSPTEMVAHTLVVERPEGLLLVDTGFGRGDVADPKRLGQPFRAMVRPTLDPAETVHAQLLARGLDPADVTDVVLTHLDLDHAGGLADFPTARVHVHEAELAAATALAELVGDDLSEDYVVPGPFDPRVPGAVSSAVAEAARRDGVARR